jgi:hypothetical protein
VGGGGRIHRLAEVAAVQTLCEAACRHCAHTSTTASSAAVGSAAHHLRRRGSGRVKAHEMCMTMRMRMGGSGGYGCWVGMGSGDGVPS